MARPDVNIVEANGALGRINPPEDGTTLLIGSAVADSHITLGVTYGPFVSLADAVAAHFTAKYDDDNGVLIHKHIADFFDQAGNGVKLYVLPLERTVKMSEMVDNTLAYGKSVLTNLGGEIKLVIVSRVPEIEYEPTYSGQFDADLFIAAENAQILREAEFALHRPVTILIEGRDFQGNVSSTEDLRDSVTGPNANRVGIVVFNDYDFSQATYVLYQNDDDEIKAANDLIKTKYASVGYAGGRLAGLSVQRNMGRVKDGKRSIKNAGLSNGASYSTLSDANVNTLHDHGYIFLLKHAQKAGFFFNSDPAACPNSDDYSSLSRGRVMDKVARLVREVLLEELNDNVTLDPATGQLDVSTCKHFQGEVEKTINANMTVVSEISGVSCFVDPNQDVLATDKIKVLVKILPVGVSSYIDVTLTFDNPLAA